MRSRQGRGSATLRAVVAGSALAVVVGGVAFVLRSHSADTPSPTPDHDVAMGWELTPATTGLARVGLTCAELPPYTGPARPPAGAVLDRVRITSPLILSAGDITISESCIQPTTTGRGLPLLATQDNDTGQITQRTVTIRDSEFDGSLLPVAQAAGTTAFVGIADLYRNYVHGLGSGLALVNTGPELDAVVEGNVVDGLVAHGDPATTGNHSDAFTIRDFDTSARPDRSLLVRGNRFDCSSGNDTGALFVQTYAGDIGGVVVRDNLLEGGGYQLGLNAGFGNTYAAMTATNNRFSGTGYGPAYVQGGPGWTTWTDNYLNDPTAPGHRGTAVPRP